ncbi:MAG: SDR family oxidoreductase [Aestuariivirga sp.]|uniref:D-erythronate dehydrogenase n=1 Tax=Aestuariivirga sp. TaxID=2650926 RepID=UPI0025BF253C|nr:D-erythronate dehydrogenase [Aestuariivirga sp.]MCA3562620.1 SDR family oxidoreductase [Aestuariivirga sp.]
MNILVIGGGGMVGVKLINRLAKDGALGDAAISKIIRHDVVLPPPPPASAFPIETLIGDLSTPGEAEKLVALKPDTIFHLAAIVSGEAEADFEKGYRINLDGTRYLFEAIRKADQGYKPKLIFTSSIAVFGAPFPEAIPDEFFNTPLTSYGTQKTICELLLADYSRRGFFDGVGLRFPTICVRPGKPNLAASGFFSNIIREPLAGQEAVLPVPEDVRHWHASPRAAAGFLIHAATMDTGALGARRNITLPGVSCTVGEQIEALRKVAGDKVVARIKREPNETIMKIVAGWPRNFEAKRGCELGFQAENSFEDIIRVHIEDELGGKIA